MKEELDEAVQTLVNDYTLQGLEYIESVRMENMNHALRGSEKSREAVDLSVRCLLEVRSAIEAVKAQEISGKTLLPTIPGYYIDRDGDVWRRFDDEFIYLGDWDHLDGIKAEHYAPFTRLVAEQ